MILFFFRKGKSAINFIKKIIREIYRLSSVPNFLSFKEKEFVYSGVKYKKIYEAEKIYLELNGKSFSLRQHIFLFLNSNNCLIVVENTNIKKIVGINFYYMNDRDFKDGTIHEGFIGVLPNYERKGLATTMRRLAKEHFKNAGFKGISSRISKNNISSLRSAEKIGFMPVDEYFDVYMNEERYYMICDFVKKYD